MNNPIRRLAAVAVSAVTVGGALISGGAAVASAAPAHPKRVLLISVDGLHQSDLAQCTATDLCPNLAALEGHGTNYTNAMTSEPSDSSPGLMALTTGGSPKLTGVYYDDSYDRSLFAPAAQTPTSSQNCSGPPGAETMYAENIDTNAPSTANNQTGTRTILHEGIDPTQLPYGIVNGACVPIQPNDFLRTNSIFSVIHQAGLRTAWADKHPAADQQVSGHGTPTAVDDKFMTEINADIIPPTLVDTRGRTVTFPLPNPTGDPNGYFITDKVGNTEAYDQVKVDAILNEIDGLNSAGTSHVGTPAIFGMNFQTVSVSQKLVDPQLSCVRSNNAPGCDPHYVPGGYEPGTLRFTPQLGGAIASVDSALGSMVSELRSQHLLDSTQIIITAKHGQSPIDPSKLALIGHAEDTVLSNAGIGVAQTTDDDIALLWLKSQSQAPAAVDALEADRFGANTARIKNVLSGEPLADKFGNPLGDPRTPDLIVQPIPGTIYSTSGAKVAEHGGFSTDDTHVALLVVNGADLMAGGPPGHSVATPVQTAQVAPTILASVGLNPRALDAARIEHVGVLPGAPLH
ncbi:MAG: alkaline phosphatase family protein [Actinomycetota bacterium]|nr:alkaline phosphatase family protein [Actinomycetota bacterium]